VAHVVAETANMTLRNAAPYVGHSAFAHKGGVHVSAMREERIAVLKDKFDAPTLFMLGVKAERAGFVP
jgi:hypothetical protein